MLLNLTPTTGETVFPLEVYLAILRADASAWVAREVLVATGERWVGRAAPPLLWR